MVLGLDRMEELLRRLGNPQDDLKVIHVAGTNGKGSVSKYLEEGLSACGYKMGLYTSPYIETFNERIRYDGADISDEDLEYYGQKVVSAAEAMVADGLDSPTEFEVVTAHRFPVFCGQAGGYHDPGSGAWRYRRFHQCGEKPAGKRHHVHFI